MSVNNVDQRVVEMKFDNAKFEQNVKTSMSTIEKLKSSLNLLGAAKGFENIDKASKRLDFSDLSYSLQNVGSKFSAMSVVAFGALEEIGRKAVAVGERVARSLTIEPIKQGFDEYELKMGSVQTIMAGTGADLDKVMAKLNELNAYADRTIYSFSDMTNNIGKFTNAGVDLDTSVAAIQGVANVAAVSGANAAEASRAMYNFAQALSSGYVKLIDWKSIENANMATVEFKNQLLEAAVAAGTVEKTSDGMYKVLGTNAQGGSMKEAISATKNFNDSLSYQWMTTEVLTSTLAKYSDETTDIGKKAFAAAQDVKTFSQLMDTLKEAVGSGWAETWENVFGNFEEAKQLWTGVNNVVSGFIDRSSKARNAILSTWKAAGGRDDLIAAFSNIFNQISGIAKAVRYEFTKMFPKATAGDLWKLTKRFRDFTETLDLVHAKFHAIRSKDGDNIVKTFKGIFAAIGIVKDVVVALIKPIGSLFSGFGSASSGILSLTGNLGDYLVSLKETIEQSGVLEQITERLGNVFSAVGGFVANVVATVQRFVIRIKAGFGVGRSVIDFLFELVGNVTHLVFQLVSALTGKDISAAEGKLSGFLLKIRNGFMAFWNVIQPVLNGIAGLFSGSFDAIKAAFDSLKNVDLKPATDLSDKTEKTFSPLSTLFSGIKKLFEGFGALISGLKPVFSGIISGIGRILGVVGTALSEIIHNFDFSKLVELLSGGLKVGIGAKLYGFINGLKKTADKAPGVLGSIKEMFGGLKELFGGLKELFGNFSEMMDAKTLETKSKALKNIAIAIGILAASLFVLSSIEPHKLQASMTAITVLVVELVGAMEMLGTISKKANLKQLSKTMIGLSAAVLVLALAIKTVSGLDSEQIANGLLAVTVLLTEMVIAAKALGDGKSKKMMQGAKNAVIFAVAIRVLVSSVKSLGKLQPEQLVNGMIGVTILIAEMVAAAKILGNDKGSSSMMKGALNAVIFAVALRILVSSVKSLGKLQPEQLINGMIGVTILIAEMVAAAKILGNDKGSSSMMKGALNAVIFAAALKILVSSVKGLGQMQPDQLITGLVGMAAVLTEMIVAMKLMSMAKGGAGSMIAAAAAMMVLALSLKVLGTLSWEQLGKGLLAIAGAFTILGVAGYVLGPVVGTILALSGAMALMGVSAVMFGAGMLMISAAFAALGGSTLIAVDAIIAAIISLITAIPEMVTALAQSLQESGTSIITCLVEVARAALIALKEVVPEAVEVVLELILTTLNSLAENIQPIIEALLDVVLGVINGLAAGMPEIITATITLLKSIIEAIMGAFDGMSVADLLEASAALALFGAMMAELAVISVLALVAVLPLPTVGAKLSQFIEAAKPFLEEIQNVDPVSLQGAKALAEMILILTANGILDALTSWFTGGSSMVDFGKQLAEFAPYMKRYSDSIKGIDNAAVEASANAALALATMAANLPNSGGVVSWFTGDNSLSDFADELVEFGPKLKQYADSVTGLNAGVVVNSVIAAQVISNFAKNLPNSGGVVSWFTGDNSLSTFADELALFGPKLKAYADSVSGMDTAVVIQSMNAAKAISEFAANLPNSGGVVSWFTGDNTISKFGEGLAEFGSYLADYSAEIKNVDIGSFLTIIPGLQMLVGIVSNISSLDLGSVGLFAESLVELATSGINGLINKFVDSTVEIQSAIDETLSAAIETIKSRESDFSKSGFDVVSRFGEGIKYRAPIIKSSFAPSLVDMIRGIRNYYNQFRQAAAYLVDGFSKAIRDNTYKPVQAAIDMAKQTLEGTEKALDERSPSHEMYRIGSLGAQGLINSFYDRTKDARKAGKDFATATLDATNAVISRVADYISGGMDAQPTIRPVLDLTDVTDGFGQLNAMFSRRQAVSVGGYMHEANGYDPDASGNGLGSVVNNYNFNQTNNSPKALSAVEIYRQTNNQFSRLKERTKRR